MEGPSIHLAAEQLRPFVGRRIGTVTGNSRIGIERLRAKTVRDIFAWGKHLVFQCDTFAMRGTTCTLSESVRTLAPHASPSGTTADAVKGSR